MGGSPLLLPMIFCSALFSAASFSRHDQCLWRFEDCNLRGNGSECVVRLRCGCPPLNGSCSANSAIEVNATRARALVRSVDKYCDVSSCAVLPRRCQWTPWTLYSETCMLKKHQRFRERCCHPVHRTPINTSLYPALNARCDLKPQRRQWSSLTYKRGCYTVARTDPPPKASDDDDSDFKEAVVEISCFAALCGLMCIFLMCAAAFNRARRPPPRSDALQLPSRPTTVIVPQPGWSDDQPLIN